MGYYTDYTLTASICTVGADSYTTATIPHITLVSLEDEIEKMNIFDGGGYIEFGYYANAKWYDWEEDMCLSPSVSLSSFSVCMVRVKAATIFGMLTFSRESVSIVLLLLLTRILIRQSSALAEKALIHAKGCTAINLLKRCCLCRK